MKRHSLRTRIFVPTSAIVISFILFFTWHLGQRHLNNLENNFFEQLHQLSYSNVRTLANMAHPITPSDAKTITAPLLTSPLVKSITILDAQQKVLEHSGENISRSLVPSHFPGQKPELINKQNE